MFAQISPQTFVEFYCKYRSYKYTFKNNIIKSIAKMLVHYAFRNGPVEQMHCDGKLSYNDMKILNKYMNDRLTAEIQLLKKHDWFRLCILLDMYSFYGSDWNSPKISTDEIDECAALLLKIK